MVLLQHLSMAMMAFSTQAHAEEPKQLSIDTSADSSFALGVLVDKLMSKFDPNTKLLAALQPWEAWISASTHNTVIDYWHYAATAHTPTRPRAALYLKQVLTMISAPSVLATTTLFGGA